jgi:hypothetical protein
VQVVEVESRAVEEIEVGIVLPQYEQMNMVDTCRHGAVHLPAPVQGRADADVEAVHSSPHSGSAVSHPHR